MTTAAAIAEATTRAETALWAWRQGIKLIAVTTRLGRVVATVATLDDLEAVAFESRQTLELHPTPHVVVDIFGAPVRWEVAS